MNNNYNFIVDGNGFLLHNSNMMESKSLVQKFTPGPWKWDIVERDKSWPGLYSAETHFPLSFGCDGEEGIYLDNKFDAFLIREAPNLYKELNTLVETLDALGHYIDTGSAKNILKRASGCDEKL